MRVTHAAIHNDAHEAIDPMFQTSQTHLADAVFDLVDAPAANMLQLLQGSRVSCSCRLAKALGAEVAGRRVCNAAAVAEGKVKVDR